MSSTFMYFLFKCSDLSINRRNVSIKKRVFMVSPDVGRIAVSSLAFNHDRNDEHTDALTRGFEQQPDKRLRPQCRRSDHPDRQFS